MRRELLTMGSDEKRENEAAARCLTAHLGSEMLPQGAPGGFALCFPGRQRSHREELEQEVRKGKVGGR